MYGSYGAHFWVPWTVVLELRAAVAAVLAESRSFDQLRQACALRRQPYNVWSGGFSAHSRPCSEGLSYNDDDWCRRAPQFVLDKLSVAERNSSTGPDHHAPTFSYNFFPKMPELQ